jgi:glucose/arabinose dehydrogenase
VSRKLAATLLGAMALLAAGCGTDRPVAPASTPPSVPLHHPVSPPVPATSSAARTTAAARPAATGSVHVVRTLTTGLDVPWGIATLPGGRALLVTTRDDATVHRVDLRTGRTRRAGTVPGVVSNVGQGGEAGLLGIALAPSYRRSHRVYLYYSTSHDNRIAWTTYRRGRIGAPHVILSGIPLGVHHDGGRLAFGPDGMLYAGTGESGDTALAQDKGSLGGKILRMTPAGRPAPGNPFPGSVVWTYGHRNVQGLAFDPAGRLWASEFGDHTADELNLIRKGRDYGWPATQGHTDDRRYTSPVAQWGTEEDSPSGIAYAAGSIWMAALQGERLWRIPLAGTHTAGAPQGFLDGRYGRLRSVVAIGPHRLVVSTSNRDGRTSPRAGDDRLLVLRVR